MKNVKQQFHRYFSKHLPNFHRNFQMFGFGAKFMLLKKKSNNQYKSNYEYIVYVITKYQV